MRYAGYGNSFLKTGDRGVAKNVETMFTVLQTPNRHTVHTNQPCLLHPQHLELCTTISSRSCLMARFVLLPLLASMSASTSIRRKLLLVARVFAMHMRSRLRR